MKQIHDLVIIGGGPGGYTAALYAARAGLDVVVLEKLSAGGQMALSHQVDNYPGFPQGIDGFSLAERMQEGAERFGAKTELAEVYSLQLRENPKVIETSEGTFYGKTVILATGAGPRTLGLTGEQELVGRGVNYCAACDGMFYKGKTVAVIGGGDSAVSEALTLSRIAKEVILVHRRDQLRATAVYLDALKNAGNVQIFWNSAVAGLEASDARLTGIRLKDTVTGEERMLPCDGIFVSIGRKPATELVKNQIKLDENGYIPADETTETEIPGVFAVGDIRTKELRQIITAAADGAIAGTKCAEMTLKKF